MRHLYFIFTVLTATYLNAQEMNKIHTFLMFNGEAEEAMNYYISLFDNSEIKSISKYGPDQPGGTEGTVFQAIFTIKGQEYMCIDSNIKHDFSFTPAISLFVHCENEEEIDRLYGQIKEGGKEFMPLGNYGFSKKFGWIEDKYGVSWQLNLE